MEDKFTSGNWSVSWSEFDATYEVTAKEELSSFNQTICLSDEYNAHLIAAAPNGFALGELVIKMCDHYEGLSPTDVGILYEAAKAFVKKARGEK